MPKYSQAGRLLAVSTPLGPDALLLARFAGTEALSELFEFRLDLLAERDTDVPFDKLLGQSATVALKQADGSYRHFNGIVNRVSQGEVVSGPYGGQTFVRYAATVAPQVWLLTCKAQSRIFQQVNVPDILKQVIAGFDVDWQVQGTFHPRDYCVQYRETDWAFASRIMEEEGIYYFFKHSDGAHKLVVANTPAGHPDVPAPTAAVYETIAGGRPPDDRVHYWAKTQEVRSGKYTLWDHCFELPGQHLDATKTIQETVTVGTVDHKLKVGGNDKLELYDYPGAYAQRFDGVAPGGGDRKSDVQKIFEDNSRTVGIRMQQEAAPGLTIAGSSGCRQLAAGHKFSLQRHFNADGEYLLTRVSHSADAAAEYTQANGPEPAYQNSFTCIPAGLPFRPPQATPKARVAGTHTATVVGPPGEEIFTDKYSRVKVQFHWDRQGKNDADSSCWVRVATLWAGKQWGMIHIPRIGQEVVVDFLEGDPDQPIIVGSVYNAEQMPPYALPDHRTQSGLKTRSSLKGTEANFNELRFEDKKGAEQVYFHAERNFDRVVENDDTISVGFEDHDPGDRTVDVHNSEWITIGAPTDKGDKPSVGNQSLYVWNDQYVQVGYGETEADTGNQFVHIFNNHTMTVGYGKGQNDDGSQTVSIWKDRTVTLETGNDKLTVSKGNREALIAKGDDNLYVVGGDRFAYIKGTDALTVQVGDKNTTVQLGSSYTEALLGIELKVGQNSIKIDQTGVTIKGMMVKIEGTVMTEVKGLMTQVNGSAMLTCKGAITMIN